MAVKKATAKRKPAAVKAKAKAKPKAKKVAAKASAAAKTPKKLTTVSKAFNKSQLVMHISEDTGMNRAQVKSVFDSLSDVIDAHVKKKAVGEITLPGLMKIRVMRKPATKARKGINPFTGEPTTFKAKPARNVIKIKALKKLKDMAE
jgi:nucleoid DNA-binding protein